MDEKENTLKERIEKALDNKDLPNIHCNGFVSSLGTGDVFIILETNKRPVAILNMSYTVAKTLVEKLGGLISELEKVSGNTIMTTDYIDEILRKGKEDDTNK